MVSDERKVGERAHRDPVAAQRPIRVGQIGPRDQRVPWIDAVRAQFRPFRPVAASLTTTIISGSRWRTAVLNSTMPIIRNCARIG